ncbi:hypothetical protein BKA63DRAFT_508404 [Paraphoma chrysanthemicola]|nr:hypothetical protein BKA63DRAFT_508404 [Paraphoma chrysanthemicola]
MTKTIVITGATGAQGGGVVNILLNTPGWEVRAVTRNPTSEKAKDLVARGVKIVQADVNDIVSLKNAFEGAHAIYGLTNFWEHLFTGKSQDEAGALEEEQGMNLARAAAQIPTLEHYIWSTLPNAKKLSNGEAACAHLDYKANVDERMRKDFPELAAKTTYLFFGFYPSNMAFLPMLKPVLVPDSGEKYVQLLPTSENTPIQIAGDMTKTPGIWVRQILANPKQCKGKYAMVATETLPMGSILDIWSDVTGRKGYYTEISNKVYADLWGIGGAELYDQLKFGELVPDWITSYDLVSKEELGITSEAPGCKLAFESLKPFL